MKKILLISPLTEEYSGIKNYGMPSLGIHRLGAFLRANRPDDEITVYDCNIQSRKAFDRQIQDKQYDIIGISILNDTLALSLDLFIKLREFQPEATLVAGGPEATLNYQDILDNTDVNVVVLGEGEIPMRELAKGVPLESIPGIIYRKNNIPIDNNLFWDYYKDIDFSKLGLREYWAQNRQIDNKRVENQVRLISSSHCNRGCSFCSVTRIHEFACGRKVRPAYLTCEQLEVLLERILKQLPETNVIYFCEDSVLPTVKRLDPFCAALTKFKGRLRYRIQTETDKIINEDAIRKFAEAGVFHISFGIENCSPRIRKLMHKPQNEERIENIIKWCTKHDVIAYYLIILFSPESIVEDLVINYKTLTRWLGAGKVMVSVEPYMMPYRGAPIYNGNFEMDYTYHILTNGKILKHPCIIYPKDPVVREIMEEFKRKLPEYITRMNKEEGHKHISKDYTGKVMVKLLGDILVGRGCCEKVH